MGYEINESRSLGAFIKAKLGMQLKQYAELTETPEQTLQSRWKTKDGRQRVIEQVCCIYHGRFEEL